MWLGLQVERVQETLSDMPLYNFPVTVSTKSGANGVEVTILPL